MKTGKEIVEKYCKHQGYGNYTIDEYGLIKAINDAIKQAKNLHKHKISSSSLTDKQIDIKADEYMTEVQSNAYAYDRNTSWQHSDVVEAFREGAKWVRMQGNDL